MIDGAWVLATLQDVGNTLLGLLVIIGIVAYAMYASSQRLCQFCGHNKNQFKSSFPVCQKCGRNRVTGGAGAPHH